jgi:glycerate-2-kinase
VLVDAGLWERIPSSMRDHLAEVERDAALETPKPGNPAFTRVEHHVVAGNRLALEAAAARAAALGLSPRVLSAPIQGEAAPAGRALAATLLGRGGPSGAALDEPRSLSVLLCGGETVVRVGAAAGKGGRCQELALAAAEVLGAAGAPWPLPALLAAGTDGRDGPTDAAGAIVDGRTWAAIRRAGRDPVGDLESHNAYHALDAAGALLRTGLTGTNVMDIVIGLHAGA